MSEAEFNSEEWWQDLIARIVAEVKRERVTPKEEG